MKRNLLGIIILVGIMVFTSFSTGFAVNKPAGIIQMAILLDTSNSMDGLIGQAKSQIWKIVNELALAKRNGQTPRLEVALYEYGKSSIPSPEGFLRQIVPLTNDLDRISAELFQLSTNGGDEYCGMVIKSAIEGLTWSKDPQSYKMIVIAGNEPFTQGEVDFRKACKVAITKSVIVNTVFCGNRQEGIDTQWKEGADLAKGLYMNIDQNEILPDIKAPQDPEILKSGQELNLTYIPYGQQGQAKKEMQEAQDKNAASMNPESAVQRTFAKASPLYDSTGWDLVDAVKNNGVKILDTIKKEELPSQLQKMTRPELEKYIQTQLTKRELLQKKLNELNQERRVYVEQELKKQSLHNSFGAAMIEAIHRQAAQKNYHFQ